MLCSLKNTIFSLHSYSVLNLHATGCSLWGKTGGWEPGLGLGEDRGQEGYRRWERKEQEVAGKSELEVGQKGGKYTTLVNTLPSKKAKERE